MAVATKQARKEKPRGQKARFYWICVQRTGSDWRKERISCVCVEGQIPPLWTEVIAQPDVISAAICTSVEIRKRSDKRKHLATFGF